MRDGPRRQGRHHGHCLLWEHCPIRQGLETQKAYGAKKARVGKAQVVKGEKHSNPTRPAATRAKEETVRSQENARLGMSSKADV